MAVAPEDAHVLAAPLCSPRSDSLEVSTPSSDEYLSLDYGKPQSKDTVTEDDLVSLDGLELIATVSPVKEETRQLVSPSSSLTGEVQIGQLCSVTVQLEEYERACTDAERWRKRAEQAEASVDELLRQGWERAACAPRAHGLTTPAATVDIRAIVARLLYDDIRRRAEQSVAREAREGHGLKRHADVSVERTGPGVDAASAPERHCRCCSGISAATPTGPAGTDPVSVAAFMARAARREEERLRELERDTHAAHELLIELRALKEKASKWAWRTVMNEAMAVIQRLYWHADVNFYLPRPSLPGVAKRQATDPSSAACGSCPCPWCGK